jgi:hypothetical protein
MKRSVSTIFYPAGVPTGTDALHAGVFYSRVELGVRVTTTFDAGPANKNVSGIDGALEVAKELTGIRDPATPYGKMTMTSNELFGADSRDLRLPDDIVGANILKSGDDLFQSFKAIETTFTQAASGLYYYFPWLQNSNTVAMTALSNGALRGPHCIRTPRFTLFRAGLGRAAADGLQLCSRSARKPVQIALSYFSRGQTSSFRQTLHRLFLMEFRLNRTAMFTPSPVMPQGGSSLRLSQPRRR